MAKSKGLMPGSHIPAFSLKDAAGKRYDSKQWKGSPFLLYFLRGTW